MKRRDFLKFAVLAALSPILPKIKEKKKRLPILLDKLGNLVDIDEVYVSFEFFNEIFGELFGNSYTANQSSFIYFKGRSCHVEFFIRRSSVLKKGHVVTISKTKPILVSTFEFDY